MIVYTSLLIVTVTSLTIYKSIGKKIWAMIPYAFMAFVSGFRSGVGADYDTYKYWFYDILAKRGWYSNTELGYKLLTIVVHKIGGNYQLILLLMAIVTSACYYSFIMKFSSDFILSTMVYMCFGIFYFSSFNGARESLAIGLFLYALKYIDCDRNGDGGDRYGIVKYIAFIVVATMFHKSAFIFAIFPFALKKIGKNHLLHLIILTVTGTIIINGGILDATLKLFFPAYYRYSKYVFAASKGYLLFLFMGIVIILLCYRFEIVINHSFLHLLVFSTSMIAIMYLTGRYEMFLSRYASWGLPSIIILIPALSRNVKPRRVYSGLVYIVCLLYFFNVTTRGVMMLPYAFNFKIFG